MNVTEVKSLTEIKTDKHDDYILTILPYMIESIKEYCNNQFLDVDGNESLPGGARIAISKWIQFNILQAGVNSRSQGVSYNYETEVPNSIKIHLKPYKRLRW